ncbi:MAG TPA: hypothetical protein VHE58_06705 [Burkholderiales bacterium]|nr:hypothetical protein [Burkholderiales bacterium]
MVLVDTNVLLDVVSRHSQRASRLLPSNQRLAREFLDREQERYRVQLGRYAALMRMLDGRHFSSLPFKGRTREGMGFYSPLLKGWREWSPDMA